jgi:arylsulfatase
LAAEIPAWDSLSPQQKTLYARQMEIYAAFIAHTDHEVGRLLQAVNADPRSEDTVVLYLVGDNGPEGAIGMEGAENIVATAMGRAQSLADQIHHMDELGGPLHTNIYSAGWAWMGSTPFKWMKHVGSHLGGVRNPLIVSWPARIRDQGGLRSGFAHVTDVVPTLYDIAGLVPPSNVNGVVQSSFDGVSFAASFGSPTAEPGHRVQYFEIQGNRAIYSDGWMAAARHTVPWIERPWAVPPLTTDQRWELYHLGTDFTQSRDLAERDPVRLASMRALFDQQALVNRVQPIGISVGTVRRSPVEGQKRFIYDGDFPGVSLGARVTPDLTRPYRLTAAIELKTMDSQGVLFAAGGRGSGVVLHVREQHLVFESNYLGQSRDALVSTERLPLGRSRITLDFSAPQDDEGQRTVQLYIEDRPAGEVRLRKFSTPDPLDNFDIGQDSGEPVGAQYEPPHRFTGVVESLTIELH